MFNWWDCTTISTSWVPRENMKGCWWPGTLPVFLWSEAGNDIQGCTTRNILSDLEHHLPLLLAAISEDTHLNHISLAIIFVHLQQNDVMLFFRALLVKCISTGCHYCCMQTEHKRASPSVTFRMAQSLREEFFTSSGRTTRYSSSSLAPTLLFSDSKSSLSQDQAWVQGKGQETSEAQNLYAFTLQSDYWQGLFVSKKFCACYTFPENSNHLIRSLNKNEWSIILWKSPRSISLINETQILTYCFLSWLLYYSVTVSNQGYQSSQADLLNCSWT